MKSEHLAAAFGAAVVASIIAIVGITAAFGPDAAGGLFGPTGAAWAQAVGTFLAIAVTGAAAWWEAHQRRLEAARHIEAEAARVVEMAKVEKAKLMARLAITEMFSNRLWHYVGLLDKEEPGKSILLRENFAPIRMLLGDASDIALREMPFNRAVGQLAEIKAFIEQARVVLDDVGSAPPPPEQESQLKEASSRIKSLLLELQYMIDPETMAKRAREGADRRG